MGDLPIGHSVARQNRYQSPVIRPGFGIFSIQKPLNSGSCLRGGRWQARYSLLLVGNHSHFWMIQNHWYWITRGHPPPSPRFCPTEKGHIDHSLLHLNINGKAESPSEGYHAAIARHGHAGELANPLLAGVADDLLCRVLTSLLLFRELWG